MPPLIVFLAKWTGIGIAAGLVALALFLALDVGGVASVLWRSQSPWTAIYVLAVSFACTGGSVSMAAAVLLRSDFGGTGGGGNSRLDRWRAGHSAELPEDDDDRPLP
jgi:hypothetical protein